MRPRDSVVGTLRAELRRVEREMILDALADAGGRRKDAANALGISRKGLWERMRALGVSDEDIARREGERLRSGVA